MALFSLLSMFITPILLLLALLFLLRNKLHVKQSITKQLPPCPPGLPVIGNLHQLGAWPHVSLWQLSKKYGPVMLLRLGKVSMVVVSSAETAKEMLKTHDLNTCSRPPLTGTGKLSYNYRDIAFSPYGDYYREIRKICVLELFSMKRVQSFRFIREEEVDLMNDSINMFSSSSTPVDLGEIVMSLIANITCRAAFSKSFREKGISGKDLQDIVNESIDMLFSFSAADFFPYVGWIVDRFTGLHARLQRCFHEMDSYYEQVINDHLQAKKTKQEHKDVVDILLNFVNDGSESHAFHFTQDHVKGLLMDIFIGGINTIAATVVWSMAELARNPRVMRKVQEEIRSFVGDVCRVTENESGNFEYLRMVIKETLRLHPPGTLLLPRETTSAINFNGYYIPQKTRVHVNVWAIARDCETWKNPLEFMPERFIDKPIDFSGLNYEFLPFGAGRRICPGISAAIVTMQLTLANLLYCFDWKLPNGMKAEDINMEETSSIGAYKKTPLLLIPVKYIPASAK